MTRPAWILCLSTLVLGPLAAQDAPPKEAERPASRPAAEARYIRLGDLPGCEDVVKYSDRYYRGGQPEGTLGIAELKKLGVTTILSVEEPEQKEIDMAKAEGISVVNVPTVYSGIPDATIKDLVAKYRAIDGVVYSHCHHGRHRGGAAASILRVTFDGISTEEAVHELAELGCGKKYPGLYDSVRNYRPDPATAHRVPKPLPGIDGLIEVTPWLYRGTSKLGPEAIAALQGLGIRTILSADMDAATQKSVKAAGLNVEVAPVSPEGPTSGEIEELRRFFVSHRDEKVFLHASEDVTQPATMVAVFRVTMSKWSPEEAATEIMALVGGDRGTQLAAAAKRRLAPRD